MLDTETTMDELFVAEPVQNRSAATDGLVSAVSLIVILTIAISVTAALFLPVVQTGLLVGLGWVFAGWGGP